MAALIRIFLRLRRKEILHIRSFGGGTLNKNDVGKMYVIPPADIDIIGYNRLLPTNYREQLKTLKELAFLCRNETYRAYQCLEDMVNFRPNSPLRVVIWGKFGTGKSLTLHQLIYFAHARDFVIITINDAMKLTRPVMKFLKAHPDLMASSYAFKAPGRIDSPLFAQGLFELFKQQNKPRWKELMNLKTTKAYKWSELEETQAGKPLMDILELGLSAPYLATDCLTAFYSELRAYASSGAIKILVAIDHSNALFGRSTLRKPDSKFADVGELTVVQELIKFLEPTWSNGVCALVADKKEAITSYDRITVPINTPLELFGEEGFDKISPFVPIETKPYSEAEANLIHNYYCERNWLTTKDGRSAAARKQIYHLSGCNPFYYERICAFN